METRIRCYTTGDKIKLQSEITEADKPEFHELSETELLGMFKDLIPVDIVEDDIEIPDNLQFNIHGPDWYRDKFPGFKDEYYCMMAEAAELENAKDLAIEKLD